jgi:Chromosome segregation protein Spc25
MSVNEYIKVCGSLSFASFHLPISFDIVPKCQPMVPHLAELLNELNEKRDYSDFINFIKYMRKAFKETL